MSSCAPRAGVKNDTDKVVEQGRHQLAVTSRAAVDGRCSTASLAGATGMNALRVCTYRQTRRHLPRHNYLLRNRTLAGRETGAADGAGVCGVTCSIT